MTSEYLLDAMGLLDDDLIQDAEEGARPAFGWQRWGTLAACLVLVVVLGYGASQLGTGRDGSGSAGGGLPSTSSGEASAGNTDSSTASPWENSQQGESSAGGSPEPAVPGEGEQQADTILVRRDGQTLAYCVARSVEELPEDGALLGRLERTDGAPLYTDREEYAGCEVWEDGSGLLYVRLPDGTFAQAELVQP